MKKILFICPYPLKVAAGQRLKFEPHFKNLTDAGYEISVHSFMHIKLWKIASLKGHSAQKIFWTLVGLLRRVFLLSSLRKFDCVYIFMNVFPFGPPILEKLYLKLSHKVIFDIEDDLLTDDPGSINWIASILKSKKKSEYLIKYSDNVIASSPDLAKKCNAISRKNNAIFIPPTLEKNRFIPKKTSKNKKIVVGWTGTFSSRSFLDEIIPQLEELYRKKDFKFMVIGNFQMENKNLDLDVIQWNEVNEIDQLQIFDIGLYPLPQNKWVSGKSGLKALQYMAMGIPAVCSAVGNVLNFIEHDKDGILIYNKHEWISSLGELIDNSEKRKNIGLNARNKFNKDFSQDTIFEKYLDLIKK